MTFILQVSDSDRYFLQLITAYELRDDASRPREVRK